MNKYLISKIIAIFFSLTTVVIFLMASGGTLFAYAGSIQAGVALYAINTVCLVVSLLVFIWLRARKNTPKYLELKTLETYAALNTTESEDELPCLFVSTDELLKLGSGVDETVTALAQGDMIMVRVGDVIRLKSPTEVSSSGVTVVVLSVNDSLLGVRLSNR